MKIKKISLLRLATSMSLIISLAACTAGNIDPAKALTQMHVTKSDDYKKRPGWAAIENISQNDCKTYKSGGKSLLQWKNKPCNAKGLIEAVNDKSEAIPVFYAAYHEYGSYEVGTLSSFEAGYQSSEDIIMISANLAKVLSSSSNVDAIYKDYQQDRWSMGLNEVDKDSFYKSISSFTTKKDAMLTAYQKTHAENQQRYKAESEDRKKREQEDLFASDRAINLVLWPNPSPEQQMIVDALHTIKFTIRNDGVVYANGRRFMSSAGMESLKNSLNISLESCSDVGAYVGEKILSRACVQGFARDIVEWGETAKDHSISDRAWNAAAMDGSINYNPIKYEILFSHWAGMARVYASRGD